MFHYCPAFVGPKLTNPILSEMEKSGNYFMLSEGQKKEKEEEKGRKRREEREEKKREREERRGEREEKERERRKERIYR